MARQIKNKHDAGVLLGPLFYEFCCRLYWLSSNFENKTDALLFMSRGGLRLKYLYELFLEVNGFSDRIARFPFWISRFAAVKLIFAENPEWSVACIVREFMHSNCRFMADALLPRTLSGKEQLLQSIPAELASSPVTRDNFFTLYHGDCVCSEALRRHFQEQRDIGMEYLTREFGEFKNLYTVDSGWFGSTLGSLQAGCRNWKWKAIYFGRWNYRNEVPWYFHDIIPLVIDADGLRGTHPADIMLEYHHLIESVLEPELPSVEYYMPDGTCNAMIPDWQEIIAGSENEELWQGILAYFRFCPSVVPADVVKASCGALKFWKCVLRYPNPAEAGILEVPARSSDFGRAEKASIFLANSRLPFREYWRSVKRSLWPAGAIAASSGKKTLFRQIFWHICRRFLNYRGAV